jgi:hypothetical protein
MQNIEDILWSFNIDGLKFGLKQKVKAGIFTPSIITSSLDCEKFVLLLAY